MRSHVMSLSSCLLLLVNCVASSVNSAKTMSSVKTCQHLIIESAEYTQSSLDLCQPACKEKGEICVQSSSEHEQNSVSAVCRSKLLTSQEVFHMYQHCQCQDRKCHVEALPGLLGPTTAQCKCLERNDSIQIIDPCEEGSYNVTPAHFLYGYRRVVNTSRDVTCSCSLTKTTDTSNLVVSGVNSYSFTAVSKFPKVSVAYENRHEYINSSLPTHFIVTSRARISLTLTVSSDHKIGRIYAIVTQQGDGQLFVNCVAVQGTVPVDNHQTVGVSWIMTAQVTIDTFVVFCLAISCAIFWWTRKLKKDRSVGDGESERRRQPANTLDRSHDTIRDDARDAGSHEGTAPRQGWVGYRRLLHLIRHARKLLQSRTGNVQVL